MSKQPHERPVIDFSKDLGVARQEMKDECDINNILAKFRQTGVLTHRAQYQARYGDTDSMDYHEALNTVTRAESMFEDLPAHLRKRFGNTSDFLDFCADPDNLDEMVELGLRPEGARVPPEGGTETIPPDPPAEPEASEDDSGQA